MPVMTPEQLAEISVRFEKLTRDFEEKLLEDIARRIAKAGMITDTAEWQLIRLKEMGYANEFIEKALAEYTKKSEEEIRWLFFDAGQCSDEFYSKVYAAANKNFLPIDQNPEMMQYVEAGIAQTNGELHNYTRSMGFRVMLPNGTTAFKPVAKAYQSALDLAQMQVSMGVFDYNTAIRNATKALCDGGLQFVDYESGHVNHADVAVRRAVLTGVSQLTGKISEHNAAELETDIVEVTAHAGARPDHSIWQGRWYSLSGKSKKYPSLVEVTGYGTGAGLKGWNCRHDFYPVIEGVSVPTYTEEELMNIDPPPLEYNGKLLSYYECTQRQRQIETAMRKTKRQIIAAKGAGDEDMFTAKSVLLRRQKEEYNKFSKAAGLLTQNERTQVYGFDRSTAAKSSWAARKAEAASAAKVKVPKGSKGSSSGSGGHAVAVNVPTPPTNGGKGKLYRDEGLTNGYKSGKIQEKEKEYGVPYGIHSVNPDMNYIKSSEYKAKFKNATNNSGVNNTLYECSLSSIEHRAGSLKEDMYIIHAETGKVLAKQLDSPCEQGIIYNDEIKSVLKSAKENNTPIIAFHNHPEGYPPSVDDINKAFDNNYVYGFVGGHNGQLYRYTKPLERVNNADEIHESIAMLCEYGTDVDRAFHEIFNANNINYEIVR